MAAKKLTVTMVPIEEVRPYPNNPRRNKHAIGVVAGSIREFGFLQPIVVDAEGVVIVGHTRLEAARQLGLSAVPVTRAADLTEQEVAAYRLVDNRVAELAAWDRDLLVLELSELRDAGLDTDFTGFTRDEVAALLDGATHDPVPIEATADEKRPAALARFMRFDGIEVPVGDEEIEALDAAALEWESHPVAGGDFALRFFRDEAGDA